MAYEVLRADPGNPVFAECAEELRLSGHWLEGIRVCLSGLSANPSCHRGRLVLARIYFEQGFIPFSVREVELLRKSLPELKSIQRLYDRFYPGGAPIGETGDTTVAESDFDISEIELVEENKEK